MKKLNQFSSVKISVALGVFVSRALRIIPNVSPLGSFGFFGGSPVLFLLSIVLFDWLIGGFYGGFIWTYLGFLMYPLMGYFAKNNTKQQLALLPAASFLFFIISNFGVWMYWYPQTLAGLIACYLAAVPFYARTLIGDLVFGYGCMLY
ncbi:MAG: DUF6580 family putative transport protein, partial [Microgenomates group bacterium]